jgi:hypothetical protein
MGESHSSKFLFQKFKENRLLGVQSELYAGCGTLGAFDAPNGSFHDRGFWAGALSKWIMQLFAVLRRVPEQIFDFKSGTRS